MVLEVVSDVTYRVGEVAQGPKLGQRHPTVNVKHLELYMQRPPFQPE